MCDAVSAGTNMGAVCAFMVRAVACSIPQYPNGLMSPTGLNPRPPRVCHPFPLSPRVSLTHTEEQQVQGR
jgi:hypothetical protein